jgi:hypothetical protein
MRQPAVGQPRLLTLAQLETAAAPSRLTSASREAGAADRGARLLHVVRSGSRERVGDLLP